MKTMKTMKMAAGILGLVLGITACGSNTSTPSKAPDGVENISIGFAANVMDENVTLALEGLKSAAEEVNNSRDDIHITILSSDGQSDVEKQLSDVETMILQQPNAIIVNAVDTTGSIPACKAVHDAGIFCVETRGVDDVSVDLKYSGMDETTNGEVTAEFYREYLETNPDVNLNAVLIYGSASQTTQLERLAGFKKLAQEMPERITILEENYTNWDTNSAQQLMEDWIQRDGKTINCVVTAGDEMALGAVNAMEASGWNPEDVIVTGFDGNNTGLSLIDKGWMNMTIKILQDKKGANMLDIVLRCLDGEYTENSYNGGSECVTTLTKDNYKQYMN